MQPFKNKPTLVGERVVLRPFVQSDGLRMFEIVTIPEVIYLTGSASSKHEINNPDKSIEAFHRLEKWYSELQEKDNRLDLAITYNDIVVGEVVINEYDSIKRQANFRVLMDTAYTSKGLGYEAIRLFLDYCIDNLPVDSYLLDVFAFNLRAKRTYEKLGFKEIGILPKDLKIDDEEFDSILMEYKVKRIEG